MSLFQSYSCFIYASLLSLSFWADSLFLIFCYSNFYLSEVFQENSFFYSTYFSYFYQQEGFLEDKFFCNYCFLRFFFLSYTFFLIRFVRYRKKIVNYSLLILLTYFYIQKQKVYIDLKSIIKHSTQALLLRQTLLTINNTYKIIQYKIMNQRVDYEYWNPYKEDNSASRSRLSPTYHYQYSAKHISNEKKISNLIITSSTSKERKRIFQVKSTSKEKKPNDQNKPRMYVIPDNYFIQKKQDRSKSPPSYLDYKNKRLEIIPQVLNPAATVKKSPIKIIKKTPPKKQIIKVPQQMFINTIVTTPSSVASSILNNFETNPDRLLGNMTESKLNKVFKF